MTLPSVVIYFGTCGGAVGRGPVEAPSEEIQVCTSDWEHWETLGEWGEGCGRGGSYRVLLPVDVIRNVVSTEQHHSNGTSVCIQRCAASTTADLTML